MEMERDELIGLQALQPVVLKILAHSTSTLSQHPWDQRFSNFQFPQVQSDSSSLQFLAKTPTISREKKSLLVLQLLDWARGDLNSRPLLITIFGCNSNSAVSNPASFRWQIWKTLRKIRIKNGI
jgi:hypothetical protein